MPESAALKQSTMVRPSTGLLKKLTALAASARLRMRVFGKGGDEDDWDTRATGLQFRLQFQPAHTGHLDIDDRARRAVQVGRGQERLAEANTQASWPSERTRAAHRGTNRFVIVDDRDDSLGQKARVRGPMWPISAGGHPVLGIAMADAGRDFIGERRLRSLIQ
jgi:hypothetical protein